jgi:adenylate cyclase
MQMRVPGRGHACLTFSLHFPYRLLILLGRFDEAVSAAKKGVRQNPLFPFTYRCLASALAHLGREAEAREAVAGLLELDPDFRISERVAGGDVLGLRLYIDGLRKAGVPE